MHFKLGFGFASSMVCNKPSFCNTAAEMHWDRGGGGEGGGGCRTPPRLLWFPLPLPLPFGAGKFC